MKLFTLLPVLSLALTTSARQPASPPAKLQIRAPASQSTTSSPSLSNTPYGFSHPPPRSLPPGHTKDIRSHPALLIPKYAPDSAAFEGGHGGRRTTPTTAARRKLIRILHGSIMGVVFVLLLPAGGILLRTLPARHAVRAHACLQTLSTGGALAGLGLGVWLGLRVRYLDYLHTILGFCVVGALLVQGTMGAVGHWRFVKNGSKEKSVVAKVHVWWGRGVLVLALVTGGLGLRLAENTTAGVVVYGVLAGISGVVYVVLVGWLWWWKGREPRKGEKVVEE